MHLSFSFSTHYTRQLLLSLNQTLRHSFLHNNTRPFCVFNMLGTIISLAASTTAILIFLPAVSAEHSRAIPCAAGQGENSPCDFCDESKAIEVTAWHSATWVRNFTLPNAPARSGGGYDVYWVSANSTLPSALCHLYTVMINPH
jgi:hypothetical protein